MDNFLHVSKQNKKNHMAEHGKNRNQDRWLLLRLPTIGKYQLKQNNKMIYQINHDHFMYSVVDRTMEHLFENSNIFSKDFATIDCAEISLPGILSAADISLQTPEMLSCFFPCNIQLDHVQAEIPKRRSYQLIMFKLKSHSFLAKFVFVACPFSPAKLLSAKYLPVTPLTWGCNAT